MSAMQNIMCEISRAMIIPLGKGVPEKFLITIKEPVKINPEKIIILIIMSLVNRVKLVLRMMKLLIEYTTKPIKIPAKI